MKNTWIIPRFWEKAGMPDKMHSRLINLTTIN